MRNLKLSFAFIIAILAVGVTVASHAKTILGKRTITACFTSIVVSDGSTQSDLNLQPSCAAAKLYADVTNPSSHIYVQSAATPSIVECPETEEEFCCAKVEETTDTRAAEINLGDGLLRYKVLQIFCKP